MTTTLEQLDWFSNKVSPFPPVSSPRSAVQRMGARRSRQRGVVLSEEGWRKLLAAKVLQNQWGEWHTFGLLSDHALMSPRIVSKIAGREVGVDRRTLNQFFATLDLELESGDYSLAGCVPKKSQRRLFPIKGNPIEQCSKSFKSILRLKLTSYKVAKAK